jgi:hypothetical protein
VSGGLIRLVQALLHPLRKRLQMANDQPQLLVLQRPARLFLCLSLQASQPFFRTADTRLEPVLFQ